MKTALFFLTISLSGLCSRVEAQDSTGKDNPFSINAYLETYYTQDLTNSKSHSLPGFIYNFNRTSEVNLNLAFLRAAYQTDNVRANLAFAAGTYMNANYAVEPGVLKNVFEANAGFRLSKSKNFWIDAGVMPSHIGFESAVGKDNWALSRSLVAENTPYFETGARLSLTSENEKWYLAALYLNGWQRIQRVEGNKTPALGTQVTFKPNTSITLNYSTFIGSDKPDSVRQMRYHHNFYGVFQLSEKVGLTAGFDIGTEQKAKGASTYNTWFVPVVIARFTLTPKLNLAARGEYFSDKKGVIISSQASEGFQTYGFSLNLDYQISPQVIWRIEARNLHSKAAMFDSGADFQRNKSYLTTSLSFNLSTL
ncbi:hypothetical protein DYBT9623_01577 [Dyadobacter sp. CECT 9623]|uniref:Beta-barrel porin-2, OmpL-like. bbp2 n=1 Tax=Dyadobacter linearis TaxID=2823330 RepID=A0ABN7R3W4_9BACT|nr:porin [Dyadobacter sp. CECT 9623]CAG5068845.1 hypothetical protein DYBT9623_01577 [Dyadobacter sp. CECT 9623]